MPRTRELIYQPNYVRGIEFNESELWFLCADGSEIYIQTEGYLDTPKGNLAIRAHMIASNMRGQVTLVYDYDAFYIMRDEGPNIVILVDPRMRDFMPEWLTKRTGTWAGKSDTTNTGKDG